MAVLLLALAGCGYQLGADMPSVIGEGEKTLKIKSVEQPTMYPWLGHMLRTNIRDEIGARHLAKWVDSGQADYDMRIVVKAFTMRSWVYGKNETTLMFTGNMTLEAIIYQGGGSTEVWRSGLLSYADTFESNDERGAAEELSVLIARQLIDRMRQTF